jgi:hypothetical protein
MGRPGLESSGQLGGRNGSMNVKRGLAADEAVVARQREITPGR